MPALIDRLLPDLATTLVVLPLTLAYASAAAAFVGWLRTKRGVRAPYTRKAFHFLIISVAALVQLRWGIGGTIVFGSTVALIVIAAVLRGDGFAFYEALARPSDAPRRSLFIIVPLVTTALGGMLANVLFTPWAHVGYLAVAWGDAVGEPVGTRWGRHPYRAPSICGVAAARSLEGSAAVLIATSVAVFIALATSGHGPATAAGTAATIGVACTLVEAVSHHGLDNLTIQLAASALAAFMVG